MEKKIWENALPHEIEFWTRWCQGKGIIEIYDWSQDFIFRFNPDAEMQQKIINLVIMNDPTDIKVLDVGAGPVSALGKKYHGINISLVATDPMAEAYDKILSQFNLVPPVRTINGDAEKLSEQFAAGEFDVIYCQNALDHSYNPVKAIEEMIKILKTDGTIMLWHENNEGENEGYRDLHQWNFCEEKGDFVIWQPGGFKVNVTDYFKNYAVVRITTDNSHNTVLITHK